MTEKRQRPIPVTAAERRHLDERKRLYEEKSGTKGSWGKFLATISLLGLAAAGVYALGQPAKRSPQAMSIRCGPCGETFPMALPEGTPRAVLIECPYCGRELVVDLGPYVR